MGPLKRVDALARWAPSSLLHSLAISPEPYLASHKTLQNTRVQNLSHNLSVHSPIFLTKKPPLTILNPPLGNLCPFFLALSSRWNRCLHAEVKPSADLERAIQPSSACSPHTSPPSGSNQQPQAPQSKISKCANSLQGPVTLLPCLGSSNARPMISIASEPRILIRTQSRQSRTPQVPKRTLTPRQSILAGGPCTPALVLSFFLGHLHLVPKLTPCKVQSYPSMSPLPHALCSHQDSP